MILGYLDAGTGSLIVQTILGGTAGLVVLMKSTGRRLIKRPAKTEPAPEPTNASVERSTDS